MKRALYADFDQVSDLTTELDGQYEYIFNIHNLSYYVDQDGYSCLDIFEVDELRKWNVESEKFDEIKSTPKITNELKDAWLDKFYDNVFDEYYRNSELDDDYSMYNYYEEK